MIGCRKPEGPVEGAVWAAHASGEIATLDAVVSWLRRHA